jgi:hypothetical protein
VKNTKTVQVDLERGLVNKRGGLTGPLFGYGVSQTSCGAKQITALRRMTCRIRPGRRRRRVRARRHARPWTVSLRYSLPKKTAKEGPTAPLAAACCGAKANRRRSRRSGWPAPRARPPWRKMHRTRPRLTRVVPARAPLSRRYSVVGSAYRES